LLPARFTDTRDGWPRVAAIAGAQKRNLPVVFISGKGDIPTSVQAMKAGAIDFLTKPFDDEQLIAAIDAATERSRAAVRRDNSLAQDRDAFERLSGQVCLCVADGMLNKQIGAEFVTKEKTIKVQRANLIKKLGVNAVSDIVRFVERLRSSEYLTK
jgi:FixJ family two-component response regulator